MQVHNSLHKMEQDKILICNICKTHISKGFKDIIAEKCLVENVTNTRKTTTWCHQLTNDPEFGQVYVRGIECSTCGNPVGLSIMEYGYSCPMIGKYDSTDTLQDYATALQHIEIENNERLLWWKLQNHQFEEIDQLYDQEDINFYTETKSMEFISGQYLLELQSLILVEL
ncbi:hypothetical protein CAAN1_27S00848 [[Candida] anglica]|uniref:Protein yippee-like n=1 Tax=[Candida] anglica TaxID=148631 RepID=A0ABP0EC76_9ASCO